jgi:hypothetical protein
MVRHGKYTGGVMTGGNHVVAVVEKIILNVMVNGKYMGGVMTG